MSVKEQFHNRLWATTSDYNEVLPYLNNDYYDVSEAYDINGSFSSYYIHLK